MRTKDWLRQNAALLAGKRVAISGSTGGIGRELCRYLAGQDADLLLLDRDVCKAEAHRQELLAAYPRVRVDIV